MVKAFLKYLDKSAKERIKENVFQYVGTGKIDDFWDEYIGRENEQQFFEYRGELGYGFENQGVLDFLLLRKANPNNTRIPVR